MADNLIQNNLKENDLANNVDSAETKSSNNKEEDASLNYIKLKKEEKKERKDYFHPISQESEEYLKNVIYKTILYHIRTNFRGKLLTKITRNLKFTLRDPNTDVYKELESVTYIHCVTDLTVEYNFCFTIVYDSLRYITIKRYKNWVDISFSHKLLNDFITLDSLLEKNSGRNKLNTEELVTLFKELTSGKMDYDKEKALLVTKQDIVDFKNGRYLHLAKVGGIE